jgi:hypothetical protein
MADGIHAKTDLSSVQAGLVKLAGPLRESLARSMAVAGGKVLRDEAKLLAPVGTEEGGSIHPGALRDAIYLAFKGSGSTGKDIRYSVSWNAKKAPHGHLIEFGHWQPYVVAKIPGGYGGGYYTTKVKKDVPTWTPAHPFLRPALDIAGGRALTAMVERGKQRLPELLAGDGASTDEP